jgi:hypothetical protein
MWMVVSPGMAWLPFILLRHLLRMESVAMDYLRILWDDPDDPNGNVQHVLEHGLSIEDVEEVLENPTSEGTSGSTGRPCVWGYTLEGLYIIVV